MKKKLFTFFVLVFGLCGVLSFFSFETEKASAASYSASVWDGNYYSLDELSSDDLVVEGNRYHIYSSKGLSYIALAVNAPGGDSHKLFGGIKIVLETDIDLNGYNWVPIGTETNPFQGSFDGNGHYIYNLKINNDNNGKFSVTSDYQSLLGNGKHAEGSDVGFFGAVTTSGSFAKAGIENLHIRNADIDWRVDGNVSILVGAIVGYSSSYTAYVNNCSVGGSICASSAKNIGAVVGSAKYAEIGAEFVLGAKSSASIDTSSLSANVGGLVGSVSGTKIYNSVNAGALKLNNIGAKVGGLVGYAIALNANSESVLIKNAYNTGEISGIKDSTVGGLVGFVDSVVTAGYGVSGVSYFNFEKVYNTGAFSGVNSTENVCGLIGEIVAPNSTYSILKDAMQLQNDNDLSICDELNNISAQNVYKQADRKDLDANNVGCFKDLSKLATSKGFYQTTDCWTSAWDFSLVWRISSGVNGGLPYIEIDGSKNNDSQLNRLVGDGTANAPYLIETAGDLAWLSNNWRYFNGQSNYFSLQNDIDLSGRTWIPIAYNTDEYFSGVFDGNGHTISGMSCSLFEQFEYNSLFAKTQNAVIKDLIIDKVSFVSEGTVSGVCSTLIGQASDSTYIVNCSDKTELTTVAAPNGAKVFYGANNEHISKLDFNMTGTYTEGYDIEIDGNGGTFYDKDGGVYQNYHVLIDASYQHVSQDIDTTFAKSLLPKISDNEGNADVLIRKGYKLVGFDCANAAAGGIELGANSLNAGAVFGLTAVWQDVDVTINVDYNAYEREKFGATNSYVESDVYGYDFYLSDCLATFEKYKSTNNSLRKGFYVKAIYSKYDQSNGYRDLVWSIENGIEIDDKRLNSAYLGSDNSIVYYAEWAGKEEYKYSLNLNIAKTTKQFASDFELSAAIENIKLLKNDGTFVEFIEDVSSYIIGDNFNLSLEFSTDLCVKEDDFYRLQINLKDGYVLTQNVSFNTGTTNEKADSSENYGVYAESDQNRELFGKLLTDKIDPDWWTDVSNVNKTNPVSDFKFVNLSGDYNVNLTLERQEFVKPFEVGNNVYFAVAPLVEEYDKVAVKMPSSSNYTDAALSEYYKSTKPFVAYNLLNGYLLSSNEKFDRSVLSVDKLNGIRVAFRYALGGSYQFYFYELSVDGEEYSVSLYKAEENIQNPSVLTKSEHIVSFDGRYNNYNFESPTQLRYFADSSFVIIYSMEQDELKFSTQNPDGSATMAGYEKTVLRSSNDGNQKIMMKFDSFVDFPVDTHVDYSDKIAFDKREEISVTGMYAQAVFEFKYYIKEGNDLVELTTNAPARISTTKCSISENGNLVFDVVSSDYYQFACGETVRLWDEENLNDYNIKIEVADQSSIVFENEVEYKNKFDKETSTYFSALSSTKVLKGVVRNGKTYDNDWYEISLAYLTGDSVDRLQAGKYLVKVVCEPVTYSLTTSTMFLDEDDQEGAEFESENDHDITTSASKTAEIFYNDQIELETNLGTNKAYVFKGWYLTKNSEVAPRYIGTSQKITKLYNELNNQHEKTGQNRFNINVVAVWIKKEINLSYYNEYAIANSDEPKNEEKLSFATDSNLSIKAIISMNVGGTQKSELQYQYSTSSSDFGEVDFALSGQNAAAYEVFGYALRKDGNIVEAFWKDESKNLHDFLKGYIEAGNTQLSEDLDIVPILKKKQINFVFHTGTSNDSYGDKHEGKVFDSNGQLILPNSAFVYEGVEINDIVRTETSLDGKLNGEEQSVVLTNLYYTREGYKDNQYNYLWALGEYSSSNLKRFGSTISVDVGYFKNLEGGHEVHFYRVWEPQTYKLMLDPNAGIWSDTSLTEIKAYEQVFDATTITMPTNVQKMGYKFDGWTYNNELIFDASGVVIKSTQLFDEKGCYIKPENVTLKAKWVAKQYNIVINFNGANSVEHNGEIVKDILNSTNLSDAQKLSYSQTYSISYTQTLSSLAYASQTIKLSQILPKREGFEFDGFYIIQGAKKYKVTDGTLFNSSLPSFVDSQNALILYAAWTYKNGVSLEVKNDTLEQRVYTAQAQTIYLAEYFDDYSANNIVLSADGSVLKFELNDAMNAELGIQLSSDNAVTNLSTMSFDVLNAKTYSVTMTLTVSDNAALKMNLGVLWKKQLVFKITISKAEIMVQEKSSSTQSRMFANAKRIMEPFFETANISSATTLAQLVKLADKSLTNSQISLLSNEEIYSFIMTKYYLLLSTNIAEEHSVYRAWSYYAAADEVDGEIAGSYQTYLTLNENSGIVSKLDYFDYYDFSNNMNSKDLSGLYGKNNFDLINETNSNEIGIDALKIYSSGGIYANNIYEIRAYLSELSSGKMSNYEVLEDETGKFVSFGFVYILPQVLDVEILGDTSTYYQAGINRVEISWQGDRESILIGGDESYKIIDNLYLKADLYTSNIGLMQEDNLFDYFDEENYLYFDNVSLAVQSGVTTYDISNRFKLRSLSEFVIMSTSGVAEIALSAVKVTYDDSKRSEIQDLGQDIFSLEIEYALEDGSFYLSDVDWTKNELYYATTSSGGKELIYEIKEHENGQRTVFVNSHVKSVSFTLSSLYIDQYTALYKWARYLEYSVSGDMEKNNMLKFVFDFDLENKSFVVSPTLGGVSSEIIESSEEGITTINYFAMFTDLVRVEYELNMPDDFYETSDEAIMLQLGKSTFDEIRIPTATGFNLVSLYEGRTNSNILLEEQRPMFENGVFVGVSEDDRHLKMTLVAKWSLPNEYEYTQLASGDFYFRVFDFESLSYRQVVSFNYSELFDYSVYWQYKSFDSENWTKPNVDTNGLDDRYVSQTLTLNGNGSYEESGDYRLVVEARLKDAYKMALENGQAHTLTFSAEFGLHFMRTKVLNVVAADSTRVIYNARERINSVAAKIEYLYFDSEKNSYLEESSIITTYYSQTGSTYFEVKQNAVKVTSIMNVGLYDVEVKFSESYYDTSEIENADFEYQILPYELDLQDSVTSGKFSFSKAFNATDSMMTSTVYVNSESVKLSFDRESGEDVGQYSIFVSEITTANKQNYKLLFGDKVLFEDSAVTAVGSTTEVGKFTITAARKLILSYDTNVYSEELIESYVAGGYSLSLESNQMKLLKAGSEYKTFDLRYYDDGTKSNITSNLKYFEDLISSLTLSFYIKGPVELATNVGAYTYYLENSSEMSKYFTSVEFDSNYSFKIDAAQIDVMDFEFKKTYDGSVYQYFALDGSQISEIANFEGVYLRATYATQHAGTDISVSLALLKNLSGENLNNYNVSANSVVGIIEKLAAELSFNLLNQKFAYGSVNENKLDVVLDSSGKFNLVSNGRDVKTLLDAGYYSIDYQLSDSSQVLNGFVCVGTHELDVIYSFDDFEITIEKPTFEIVPLQIVKNLSEGYIKLGDKQEWKDYFEDQVEISTGETILFNLYPQNVGFDGNYPIAGYYALAFGNGQNSATLHDGNVVIILNNYQRALYVYEMNTPLFVEIVDESILTQTYKGGVFEISVTSSAVAIDSQTSSIKFYSDSSLQNEVSEVEFSSIEISTISEMTKKVSRNKLVLTAEDTSGYYSNISFAKDYYLQIVAKEIDITKLPSLDKQFDGTRVKTIEDLTQAGEILGDDLSVLATFSSSMVGINKAITLSLQGEDALNYKLSARSTTASITKATAILTLTKTEYVYGDLKTSSKPDIQVVANGKVLTSTNYRVTFNFESESAQTSSAGYLGVGAYTVSIATQTSNNYELQMEETEISISQYDLDIVFEEAGGLKIYADDEQAMQAQVNYQYTTVLGEKIDLVLTREANANGKLNEMGDYFVIAASTENENYSINGVSDSLGFVRIIRAKTTIYMLLSSDETIAESGKVGLQLSAQYCGYAYDSLQVVEAEGQWMLRVSSSEDPLNSEKLVALNAYKRLIDEETSTYYYQKVDDINIENLSATMAFRTLATNVGSGYIIDVYEAVSDNYGIRMGKNGTTYTYQFDIEKKQLYFKTGTIGEGQSQISISVEETWQIPYMSKIFNDKDASFSISDASVFLTGLQDADSGIVLGESVGLDVKFKDGANLARYARATYYDFTATLIGKHAGNYELNFVLASGTESMRARIDKATMTISANSKSFVYGDLVKDSNGSVVIEDGFEYSTSFDLSVEYVENYINNKIFLQVSSPNFATSGSLKAGEYSARLTSSNSDFNFAYVINGSEQINLDNLKIMVYKKPLNLSEKVGGRALKEIFTKTYDGDLIVDNLDFDLTGVVLGDEIVVVSATYATATIGENKEVSVELAGADIDNYNLKNYLYGEIVPIIVSIDFAYDSETQSDVESIYGIEEISQLKYPFVSQGSLTANSADINTSSQQNFPYMLFKTGKTFSHWEMRFNIGQDSVKKTFLENASGGLNTSYNETLGVFAVSVGNNSKTVSFLSSLIGEDVQNLFGLYYKQNSAPVIEFVPVFDVLQLTVNVGIDLENGGSVKVVAYNEEGVLLSERTISKAETFSFDYGTKIELTSLANSHYYFTGYTTGTTQNSNYVYTIERLTQGIAIISNFAVQQISIKYDLSDLDLNTIVLPELFNDRFEFNGDYSTMKDVLVSQLILSREGYKVSAIEVGKESHIQTIASEGFESTSVADLIGDSSKSPLVLTLKAKFNAEKIKVYLDYNFDEKVSQIYVDYYGKYADAIDENGEPAWVDTASRVGYSFAGWWIENGTESGEWGVQVLGGSVLESIEETTLYAKWEINSYSVKLSVENAELSQIEGAEMTNVEGALEAQAVEFGSVLKVKLTPEQGYMISQTALPDYIEIEVAQDKSAVATITMPDYAIDFVFGVEPENNAVFVSGKNIDSLSYAIVSETKNVFGGADFAIDFKVYTGQELSMTFVVSNGYQLNQVEILDKENNNLSEDDLGIIYSYDNEGHVNGIHIGTINQEIHIKLYAVERTNNLTVVFDDVARIEKIESDDGYTWQIVEKLEHQIKTGEAIRFLVKYKTAYQFDSCTSEFDIIKESGVINRSQIAVDEWAYIDLSGITEDSVVYVNSKLATFVVFGDAVSYEMDGSEVEIPENIVFVNGAEEIEAQVGDEITLTYQIHNDYEFAGWSLDKWQTFNSEKTYTYTLSEEDIERIDENAKIALYGIFSKLKYQINFATYSYYKVGTEYNDAEKVNEIYKLISSVYFDEQDVQIASTTLYYGTSKEIKFEVPEGYSYIGFGYYDVTGFKMLDEAPTNDRKVSIMLYSTDKNISDGMTIYFVVSPLSTTLNVDSYINYDGIFDVDSSVGKTTLVAADQSNIINEYGYVDGTKVHFANFQTEQDQRKFDIVVYSGNEVYLKVETMREGYKLQGLRTDNSNIIVMERESGDGYKIFKLTNIKGGGNNIKVEAIFKPQINVINLGFVHDDLLVDGGAFEINISAQNSYKVFTSGREYSSLVVSAYTDTYFEVVAFVRAGFYVNPDLVGVLVDNGGIVVQDSLSYQKLSVVETGFEGMISFKVQDYLGTFDVSIALDNLTYTVNLKDGNTILATIRNVEFDKYLNLFETNTENISIYDERIMFANGKLQTILTKDKHNFEGYFSGQNGSGVLYIDSQGDSITHWNESGYVYDNLTSTYVLSENAYLNEETGEMIIDIYAYLSYLKTRISFEIVPNLEVEITAQDMISGIDYTNSWYYASSPKYIEVAYNTDIYFEALEIEGYIFYKFIISQRNINGEWLTDVVSTLNNVPWSTNEFAQIVECKVKVIYYTQIEFEVIGGDSDIQIQQEGTDQAMLSKGYVDTTKAFTIIAKPHEGYLFDYWKNSNTGKILPVKELTFEKLTQNLKLELYLQGKATVLDFENYDTSFGYIRSIALTSRNGSEKIITLGVYSQNKFIKLVKQTSSIDSEKMVRVGDVVTFEVWIDYGFSVVWNHDVKLSEYYGTFYKFTMTITADKAGQTIEILPIFTNDLLAFYVRRGFDYQDPNAVDNNHINMAGSLIFEGKATDQFVVTKDKDVTIDFDVEARYAISSIVIKNYNNTFNDLEQLLIEDRLVLTKQYLKENSIVGNVQILIEFTRLRWQDQTFDFELDGDGTARNKYKISSEKDLALAMVLINSGAVNSEGLAYKDAHYVLQENLDLSEKFWTPIGNADNAFNGEFDFGKFKIEGVFNAYFYSPIYYNGLFGNLGPDANIHETNNDLWYILLTVVMFVIVALILVVLIVVGKRKKRMRSELANK